MVQIHKSLWPPQEGFVQKQKKCCEGGFCVLALLQFADSLRKEWNVLHSQNAQIIKGHKVEPLSSHSALLTKWAIDEPVSKS